MINIILLNLFITKKGSATDALVWLKRGLWLFCLFLSNIVKGERNPAKAFNASYEIKLKPHHNFIVRNLFKAGLLAFPGFDTLINTLLYEHNPEDGEKESVLIKHVDDYIKSMMPILENLDKFYNQNGIAN